MFDEDALSCMFLLCVLLGVAGGGRHGQDHGRADLHLNVEEVVPDVLEIHILRSRGALGHGFIQ